MSIQIQRCHPQVHATHIDFKMSHSLKRSLEAKSLTIPAMSELTLIDNSSHVGDMHVARDRMHDGGWNLNESQARGIARCSPTYSCQS